MKMITAVIACLTLLSSAQADWNVGKSISNAGKNVSNSAKHLESNIQHAPAKVQNLGKKQQSHQKQSKPTQHDAKSTQQKAGTHKAEQKLGSHKAGQKHVDPNPPVSAGQKTNAPGTVKPEFSKAPTAVSGGVLLDTTQKPGKLPFNESLTGWPDTYNNKRAIYNGQPLRPAKPQDIAIQLP